jgi:hypothetical protein
MTLWQQVGDELGANGGPLLLTLVDYELTVSMLTNIISYCGIETRSY